jgi:hypothetical protein
LRGAPPRGDPRRRASKHRSLDCGDGASPHAEAAAAAMPPTSALSTPSARKVESTVTKAPSASTSKRLRLHGGAGITATAGCHGRCAMDGFCLIAAAARTGNKGWAAWVPCALSRPLQLNHWRPWWRWRPHGELCLCLHDDGPRRCIQGQVVNAKTEDVGHRSTSGCRASVCRTRSESRAAKVRQATWPQGNTVTC